MMKQLMCIECGAVRPKFIIPETRQETWLLPLLKYAFYLHALSGLSSSVPETRKYWRQKNDA